MCACERRHIGKDKKKRINDKMSQDPPVQTDRQILHLKAVQPRECKDSVKAIKIKYPKNSFGQKSGRV